MCHPLKSPRSHSLNTAGLALAAGQALLVLALAGCCHMVIPSHRFHAALPAGRSFASDQEVAVEPAGVSARLPCPAKLGGAPLAVSPAFSPPVAVPGTPQVQPPLSRFHPVPTRPVFAPQFRSLGPAGGSSIPLPVKGQESPATTGDAPQAVPGSDFEV